MKPIALIVLLGLLKQASGQIDVIWDRTYPNQPFLAVEDVAFSDTGRILLTARRTSDYHSVYHVYDLDGALYHAQSLNTNTSSTILRAIYPISGGRAFVHCNGCWRTLSDNVTRLYSATEQSLGSYVTLPGETRLCRSDATAARRIDSRRTGLFGRFSESLGG